MAESMSQFLYDQFFTSLPDTTASLAGKTAIITGSNVGLGLEAARKYAACGVSKLILAVRTTSKGEEAKQDILKSLKSTTAKTQWVSSGVTGGDQKEAQENDNRIEVWPLDLSSYKSVQAFADRVDSALDRLDICIENAGIAVDKFERFEDNESTITTNVISTFLLAHLLLPKMKDTASRYSTRPTLTIISSGVHFWTQIPERKLPGALFDNLNNPKTANMKERYSVSKLLEVFYVREFCAHHPASTFPVTVNMVDPGFCWSTLARDAGGWSMWLMRTALARSTEYGSRTLAYAGTCGEETHGEFMANCQVRETAKFVRSEEGQELQKKVYSEVNEKLEKIKPGITSV